MFKDIVKKILGCLHRDVSQNEVSLLDDRQEPRACKQGGHVHYLINFLSAKIPWF